MLKINKWTQINKEFTKEIERGNKKRKVKYALFQCECGNQGIKEYYQIKCGASKQCRNCRNKKIKEVNQTHIKSNSPEYISWQAMKDRCNNPNNQSYHNYGKKGVKVCKRWEKSFECFLSDMGKRPNNYSLDRINHNKDYSPDNCRWASPVTQARNKSTSSHNQITPKLLKKVKIDLDKGIMTSKEIGSKYKITKGLVDKIYFAIQIKDMLK